MSKCVKNVGILLLSVGVMICGNVFCRHASAAEQKADTNVVSQTDSFKLPATAELTNKWATIPNGDGWQVKFNEADCSYLIAFPGKTTSFQGDYIELRQKAVLPEPANSIEFEFSHKDDYTGTTADYHFMRLLVDKQLVWEKSVVGGSNIWEKENLDISWAVKGKQTAEFSLQVYEELGVDNFPIRVWYKDAKLIPSAKPPDKATPRMQSNIDETNMSWYCENMCNERFWIRQPTHEMKDGRVFILWDSIRPSVFDYHRVRQICRELKWMGVTDIMYADQSGEQVAHPTSVPLTQPMRWVKLSPDPLMTLCQAAHEEGQNIWVLMHPNHNNEKYSAKDAQGILYKSGEANTEDMNNPALLNDFYFALFDEYSTKYNKYHNFKGIYLDEIFFNACDLFGDDFALYTDFCKKQFGEKPPEEIAAIFKERFGVGKLPVPWWQRYILFRNSVVENFQRKFIEGAHARKLEAMIELRPTAMYADGYMWGIDSYALSRIGADWYFTAGGCEPVVHYPKSLTGAHECNSMGYYQTYALRGKPELYFAFDLLLNPLAWGVNPDVLDQMSQHFRNVREWIGAESLTKVAILMNESGLLLSLKERAKNETQEINNVFDIMSGYQDMDMLYVRDNDYFARYKVLIAPPSSLRYLPEAALAGLLKFVEQGGTLITLGGVCTTSRADLTNERDVTEQVLGVEYTGQATQGDKLMEIYYGSNASAIINVTITAVKIKNPDAQVREVFTVSKLPAITELKRGQGRIVGIHFNVQKALCSRQEDIKRLVNDVVRKYVIAPVTGDGNLKIMTTLKKKNWIAVTLYPQQKPTEVKYARDGLVIPSSLKEIEYPVEGRIAIDPEQAGVDKKLYRIMFLSRNHEFMPPDNSKYWTAAQLKAGIPIMIVENNKKKLKLPFKTYGDRWNKKAIMRCNEHEIVVVAPYDELQIEEPQKPRKLFGLW